MKKWWKIVGEHRWAKEHGCRSTSTCCLGSQNRITELSDFDKTCFFLAPRVSRGSIHLPLKKTPEHRLVQWWNRLHRYLLAFVYMNNCACVHTYRCIQMKSNNVHQLDWQRPCFWERHVYGSWLTLLLSEPTPLFINWLDSPAGPQ